MADRESIGSHRKYKPKSKKIKTRIAPRYAIRFAAMSATDSPAFPSEIPLSLNAVPLGGISISTLLIVSPVVVASQPIVAYRATFLDHYRPWQHAGEGNGSHHRTSLLVCAGVRAALVCPARPPAPAVAGRRAAIRAARAGEGDAASSVA